MAKTAYLCVRETAYARQNDSALLLLLNRSLAVS